MDAKLLIISVLLSMVQGASKYYDGPIRPYEFGFNIEGHQHRKESKDKNGIIMGEFGFITADNVYHVTVYATDEDGNFKIVSMKNYKLGPTMAPTQRPPAPAVAPSTTTSTTPQPFRIITTARSAMPLTTPKPSNAVACSGCKIPEVATTTQQPQSADPSTTYVPPFKIVNKNDIDGGPTSTGAPTSKPATATTPTSNASASAPTNNPPEVPQKLIEQTPTNRKPSSSESPTGDGRPKASLTPSSNESLDERAKRPKASESSDPVTPSARSSDEPGKLVEMHTANMIQHILNGLLYRFNYTVGYHGHHEQGDRSGNKEGGYYAIGRDGIRRGVTYKANEFGYQPHVKFERVRPEETPREDTEREAGLKGFDFQWFWAS